MVLWPLRTKLTALSILAPWRIIRDLRAENERLVATITNPLLTGIQIGNGSLIMGAEGTAPALLAGMFLGMFDKHQDAKNYIELTFSSPQGDIVVTVCRPSGKRPSQIIAELKAQLEAA